MLMQIAQYLRQSKVTSLAQLTAHFAMSESDMNNALAYFIHKGQLVCEQKNDCTTGQCGCTPQVKTLYRWVG